MWNRSSRPAIAAGVFVAVVLTGSIHAAAQYSAAASYSAPRTRDGKPDLQGIWQARNTAAENLEDHEASLDLPAGRGVVVDPPDGKIPYQPWAAAKRKENFQNRRARDPLAKCFLAGVPRTMYLPFPIQIFQTPENVVILSEYVHTTRTVPLNGGKHLPDIDFWMGDSRGHWEGDVLVIDVADSNDQTWLDASGNFHSDQLHVVERYTRTAPDVLTWEATIEDPKVFTRPWKIRMPLYRNAEKNAQLLEYECNAYLEEARGTLQ